MNPSFGRERETNGLEIVAAGLPNGFHDAALDEMRFDFRARILTIVVGVDLSSPENGDREPRLRRGRIQLFGVRFLHFEPLDLASDVRAGDYLSIDIGPLVGRRLKTAYKAELAKGCWGSWLFVRETNSFVYFIAHGATFEWVE